MRTASDSGGRAQRADWRSNHDLSQLSTQGPSGDDVLSFFDRRLSPRMTASYSSESASPLQKALQRHERAVRNDIRLLATRLHELGSAVDVAARRSESDTSVMSTLIGRLEYSEHAQREAAEQAAVFAAAAAANANELHELRSKSEGFAAFEREATVAHGEIGVLRTEVVQLQEALRTAEGRATKAEDELAALRADVAGLQEKYALLGRQVGTEGEMRDTVSALAEVALTARLVDDSRRCVCGGQRAHGCRFVRSSQGRPPICEYARVKCTRARSLHMRAPMHAHPRRWERLQALEENCAAVRSTTESWGMRPCTCAHLHTARRTYKTPRTTGALHHEPSTLGPVRSGGIQRLRSSPRRRRRHPAAVAEPACCAQRPSVCFAAAAAAAARNPPQEIFYK